jgi:hypothetical protein
MIKPFKGLALFGRIRTRRGEVATFPGARAFNILRVTGVVADPETITIGADVYEIDLAADGVTAGRIQVVPATNSADNFLTAFAAKVNQSGQGIAGAGVEAVRALKISATEVAVFTATPRVSTMALAESMTNGAWDSAALRGGLATSERRMFMDARVPTAGEVTAGTMHFVLDFTPRAVGINVVVTSTGVIKAWDGGRVLAAGLLTLNNAGSVDWAATDTVHVLAME